jgi:hypothetical protein
VPKKEESSDKSTEALVDRCGDLRGKKRQIRMKEFGVQAQLFDEWRPWCIYSDTGGTWRAMTFAVVYKSAVCLLKIRCCHLRS